MVSYFSIQSVVPNEIATKLCHIFFYDDHQLTLLQQADSSFGANLLPTLLEAEGIQDFR